MSKEHSQIRPQYHFRQTEAGLLAWDVRRLVALSAGFPVIKVPLSAIAELDESHWYGLGDVTPTCRNIAEHAQLIAAADLAFPIILDQNGRVMDGMHRVCQALLAGQTTIQAVQFPSDPPPDYIDVGPEDLPYE